MTILFLGDIMGKPGRDAVLAALPGLRVEFSPDLVIANAENVAQGRGITQPIARALLGGGIDVLTLGNHAFARGAADPVFEEARLLRPANYPPGTPGRGFGVFRTATGVLVGVANLAGRAFMEPLDDPFRAIDEIIAQVAAQTSVLFVDFHAESTSEKAAFGWHCAGRVSAVVGTHTHVQTADERILPGGTAFLTDAGMCGPERSVIGMAVGPVVARFRTQAPQPFVVAEGACRLNGVAIEIDAASGQALTLTRISRQE